MKKYSNIQSHHICFLISLLLTGAILLVYWQVRGFDFVTLDNSAYVTQNSIVQFGSVLSGQGKIDEAVYHYKEALRIKPEYVPTINNSGTILSKKGNFIAARKNLNAVRENTF